MDCRGAGVKNDGIVLPFCAQAIRSDIEVGYLHIEAPVHYMRVVAFPDAFRPDDAVSVLIAVKADVAGVHPISSSHPRAVHDHLAAHGDAPVSAAREDGFEFGVSAFLDAEYCRILQP